MSTLRRTGSVLANPYKKRRVQRIPRPLTQESKFFNRSLTISAASVEVIVNNPPEGTGPDDRTGRKIRSYCYEYQIVSAALSSMTFLRVILVSPKQSNSTLGLAAIDSSIGNDKFWVLHDKLYSADTIDAAGNPMVCAQARVRQGITAEFDTSSNQVRGQVRMFIIADIGTTAIRGHVKTWFKDI